VTFRGEDACVVLAPTASVQLAQARLRDLPCGGATPVAAGLLTSLELLESEKRREPDTVGWLVLVTDGRANVGVDGGSGSGDALAAARRVRAAGVNVLFVDAGAGSGGSIHARELAAAAGAQYIALCDGGHTLSATLRSRI
jgi:magnesium chelatase subunit D